MPYHHLMESIDARLHSWMIKYPNFQPLLIGDFNLQLQRESEPGLVAPLREVRQWASLAWTRLGTAAISRPSSKTTPDHALVPPWQQERWSASVGSSSFSQTTLIISPSSLPL